MPLWSTSKLAVPPVPAALMAGLLALAALPGVSSHDGGDPGEGPGTPLGIDGFQFIGPTGPDGEDWHIVDEVCTNAVPSPQWPHIGHIYAAEDWNANLAGIDPRYIAMGSVDLWHLELYESHAEIEGPMPSNSIMLGEDGYLRGTFDTTLTDGPTWDLKIFDFHDWASYCVYMQPEWETDTWLFVGTAFPQGAGLATFMDFKYFYSPLFYATYPGSMVEGKRILFVASKEKYPAIDASFDYTPPAPVYYWNTLTFTDSSSRYGYPERDDIRTNDPDPLDLWEWWVDSDPTAAVSYAVGVSPPDLSSASSVVPGPLTGLEAGLYTVCLRVWAHDDFAPYMGGGFMHNPSGKASKDTECKTIEVINVPPTVYFTYELQPAGHGRHFAIEAFADDADGGCVTDWEWDIDGVASSASGVGDTMSIDHAFPTNGLKMVKVRVSDCEGAWSPWFADVLVAMNYPPYVSPIPDFIGPVGSSVAYGFTVFDPNGDPTTQWDSGLPVGASVTSYPGGGTFDWPFAGTDGLLGITHFVSDGELQGSEDLSILLWKTLADSDGDGMVDVADPCPSVDANAGGCSAGAVVGAASAQAAEDALEALAADGGESGSADPANLAATDADGAGWSPGTAGDDPLPDSDGDGVSDVSDNCAQVPNRGQGDLDRDRMGDVCDGDLDGDGVAQAAALEGVALDNCPTVPNQDQADADLDGVGNACQSAAAGRLGAAVDGRLADGAGCPACPDTAVDSRGVQENPGPAQRFVDKGGVGLAGGLLALVGVAVGVTLWALRRAGR